MSIKKSYLEPSKDVCLIYKTSEKIIREHSNKLFKINIKQYLIQEIFRRIDMPFSNETMDEHVCTQSILDNHRTHCQLCKYIIELYINTRLFHEVLKIFLKKINMFELNLRNLFYLTISKKCIFIKKIEK